MTKFFAVWLALVSLFTVPVVSFAAPVDYSVLTAAVDLAGITTAMLSIGTLMIGINVVRWGVKKIANFF